MAAEEDIAMHTLPEQRLSVIDHLIAEVDLLFKISAGIGLAINSGVRLWLSAVDIRQEIKAIHRDIALLARTAGLFEIDPDDRMTDRLLGIQGKTRSSIVRLRATIRSVPRWMLTSWLLRLAERVMLDQHRLLELTRVLILEHDADCSPVLEDAFETPEALMAALERDAHA